MAKPLAGQDFRHPAADARSFPTPDTGDKKFSLCLVAPTVSQTQNTAADCGSDWRRDSNFRGAARRRRLSPQTPAKRSSSGVQSPRTISLRSDDTDARSEPRRCFVRSDRSRIGQQVEGRDGFKSSRPDSHPAYFAHFGECWRDSELLAVRRQRCRVSGPEPGCPVTDQNLITALPMISPVLRRSIYSLI